MLSTLAKVLTAEVGNGFVASNLRYMRLFYKAFPLCDALRHELSWTHYRRLLRVDRDPVVLEFLGLPLDRERAVLEERLHREP